MLALSTLMYLATGATNKMHVRAFDRLMDTRRHMPLLNRHAALIAVALPQTANRTHDAHDHHAHDERVDQLLRDEMAPADRRAGAAMRSPRRRAEFEAGRVALRRAVSRAGHRAVDLTYAIGKSEHGAPVLSPDPGYALPCSISHTQNLAVALALEGESAGECAVGVDVEPVRRPTALAIAKRVLSPRERGALGAVLAQEDASVELTLRFCIKEALYKALHPLVGAHIPWHSVVAEPRADGSCSVELEAGTPAAMHRLHVETAWERIRVVGDDYFLAVASAAMR